MRLTRLSLVLPLVFVTSAALARAQASSNDASHRAAVKQLMEVTRVRQMTDASMETMLNAQLQQMPQIAPFQNVLRDFYKEQLSWAVLEPELTNVYLEVFSEQE